MYVLRTLLECRYRFDFRTLPPPPFPGPLYARSPLYDMGREADADAGPQAGCGRRRAPTACTRRRGSTTTRCVCVRACVCVCACVCRPDSVPLIEKGAPPTPHAPLGRRLVDDSDEADPDAGTRSATL